MNIVSDYVLEILKVEELESRTYRVSPVDMLMFNVDNEYLGGLVDLHARTCPCMEYNCLEI